VLVLQTAKHWGVAITPEMIGREKAKGNANNDWVSRMRVHSSMDSKVSFTDGAHPALSTGADAEAPGCEWGEGVT
jgi:hypothetical protein